MGDMVVGNDMNRPTSRLNDTTLYIVDFLFGRNSRRARKIFGY